ncbi:MAG: redoxin domain-containing protein [Candidatus Omnitrophica bacterium]|nr:redoxin domain-containing protein [Candidatus Omnitrophota bacterium]
MMKNYFSLSILILSAVIFFSGASVFAQTGQQAADFILSDINGQAVALSSYQGKQAVFLFFWTTWCPYCRKELKFLSDKYAQLLKEGFEVLTIDAGEPAYKVGNFIASRSIKLKVLLDRDTAVSGTYGIIGIPTYFLVDRKGYIIFRGNSFPRDYKTLLGE